MAKYEVEDNYIGTGEEEKKKLRSGSIEWYKGEKGRVDRVAIVYFNTVLETLVQRGKSQGHAGEALDAWIDAALTELAKKAGKSRDAYVDDTPIDYERVRFYRCLAAYAEGKGFFEVPTSIPSDERKVWSKLGEPREYLSTLLVRYHTDKHGNLLNKEQPGWDIMPWRFAPKIWEQLAQIHAGLQESSSSLAHNDLKISCEDTKYQKLTITAAGPALWRKNEDLKVQVIADSERLRSKVKPFRIVTTEALAQILGIAEEYTDSKAADVLASL